LEGKEKNIKSWKRYEKFGVIRENFISLQKIGGTRTSKSKLSCHSLALSLHKIGGTRASKSKLSCHSLALSLQKIGGTRLSERRRTLAQTVKTHNTKTYE